MVFVAIARFPVFPMRNGTKFYEEEMALLIYRETYDRKFLSAHSSVHHFKVFLLESTFGNFAFKDVHFVGVKNTYEVLFLLNFG